MTDDELAARKLLMEQAKLDLDIRRLEFEVLKYSSENRFFRRHSAVMITAAVTLVGLLISATQFGITVLNNAAQNDQASRDRDRQYQITLANLLIENIDKINSTDARQILFVRNIVISSFPTDFASDFFTRMAFIAPNEEVSALWAQGVLLTRSAATLNSSSFATVEEALRYFSDQRIRAALPAVDTSRYRHVETLIRAFYSAGFHQRELLAGVLANLMYETGGFRTMEEYASGDAYEGRGDLGNTEAGDGKLYKGRGYIQIVGRANYRRLGEQIGVDLEKQPQLAARPDIAAKIAVAYFQQRFGGGKKTDIVSMRRLINGGTNGLETVQRYYLALMQG